MGEKYGEVRKEICGRKCAIRRRDSSACLAGWVGREMILFVSYSRLTRNRQDGGDYDDDEDDCDGALLMTLTKLMMSMMTMIMTPELARNLPSKLSISMMLVFMK